MSFDPKIRCTGRVYPNAPVSTKAGCIGRVAPYYFTPRALFSGVWAAAFNWVVPCRWVNATPASGWDVQNNWYGQHTFNPLQKGEVQVWTVKVAGVWTLYAYFKVILGPNNGTHIRYKSAHPNGFSQWVNPINVSYDFDLGWAYGKPPNASVYPVTYAMAPPDICILP